jgi:hypothetical protein
VFCVLKPDPSLTSCWTTFYSFICLTRHCSFTHLWMHSLPPL